MKKILLTVHDVTPAHQRVLEEILETLHSLNVDRYTLLVVPDHHGQWPIGEFPDFCRWMKGLEERGAEFMLHGFTHRGDVSDLGPIDRVRATLFTRGEGEFLGLSESDADKLLRQGSEVLKLHLGFEVRGFVAPAWLYSRGTTRSLSRRGFIFAEDRWRIWNPSTGKTILRVPVVNFAGGSLLKRSLAELWVGLSGLLLAGCRTTRFAVHPCDFESEAMKIKTVNRLRRLLKDRKPVSSSDLTSAP